jgi:hypothetical protein
MLDGVSEVLEQKAGSSVSPGIMGHVAWVCNERVSNTVFHRVKASLSEYAILVTGPTTKIH